MFWTDNIDQKLIDGEIESMAPDVIRILERQARQIFDEDTEQDLIRWYIFLTHSATQAFLKPMLIEKYGSVEDAKQPTLSWLKSLGSLETICRCTRAGQECENPKTVPVRIRKVPGWYELYLQSDRWANVKQQAQQLWSKHIFIDGQMRCTFNHRHEFSEWHHADYGLVGTGGEFRVLLPVCNGCHTRGRQSGPAVPAHMPEAVKQWIDAKEPAACR